MEGVSGLGDVFRFWGGGVLVVQRFLRFFFSVYFSWLEGVGCHACMASGHLRKLPVFPCLDDFSFLLQLPYVMPCCKKKSHCQLAY